MVCGLCPPERPGPPCITQPVGGAAPHSAQRGRSVCTELHALKRPFLKGNEARRCFSRCLRAFRSPPSGNPGYRCVASLWNVGFLARRLDPLLFRKRRHYQKGASPGKRRGRISAPLRHVPCACGIGIAEKTKGGMSLLQRIAAARGDLTGDGRLETVTLFGVRLHRLAADHVGN